MSDTEIKVLTLADLKKNIEEDNVAFWNSTSLGQRVMIARDVLDLLKSKKITAKQGVYVGVEVEHLPGEANTFAKARDMELQDILLQLPTCEVCGLGALFVAGVRRLDNLTLDGADPMLNNNADAFKLHVDAVRSFLSPYFDMVTLGRIEAVFEMDRHFLRGAANNLSNEDGEGYVYHGEDDEEDPQRALMLKTLIWLSDCCCRAGYSDSEDRLTKIMETIVAQKGEYKPWLLFPAEELAEIEVNHLLDDDDEDDEDDSDDESEEKEDGEC